MNPSDLHSKERERRSLGLWFSLDGDFTFKRGVESTRSNPKMIMNWRLSEFKGLESKETLFCKNASWIMWIGMVCRSRKELLISRDRNIGWSWKLGISNGMSRRCCLANLSESCWDRGERSMHGPPKNSWNEKGFLSLHNDPKLAITVAYLFPTHRKEREGLWMGVFLSQTPTEEST